MFRIKLIKFLKFKAKEVKDFLNFQMNKFHISFAQKQYYFWKIRRSMKKWNLFIAVIFSKERINIQNNCLERSINNMDSTQREVLYENF